VLTPDRATLLSGVSMVRPEGRVIDSQLKYLVSVS
jgi:hypothetical protein